MKRVYTIIDVFSIGDYDDLDQCFIAHYENIEDARKAYETMLDERGHSPADGEEFDTLVSCGNSAELREHCSLERIFIRHEEVQDNFDFDKVTIK